MKVFEMSTLIYFYCCNFFYLIISESKSYLNSIRTQSEIWSYGLICGSPWQVLMKTIAFKWVEGVQELLSSCDCFIWNCSCRRSLLCFILKYKPESLVIKYQILRFFFFTDFQFFSSVCPSFTGRSIGNSLNFVYCLMLNIFEEGLGILV